MEKAAFFFKMYFPFFLLGAIFGKVIEMSGFAKSICAALFKLVGDKGTILSIVIIATILSYGGVSTFVVVFAVYPFAAEIFRMGNIPKRLIPGAIWLGGITYTLDALPGTPQTANIIPTAFFKTTIYAAPVLGLLGAALILIPTLLYLEWQRRQAKTNNETYDSGWALVNEPENYETEKLPSPWIAMLPLVVVWILNYLFTKNMQDIFGSTFVLDFPGMKTPVSIDVAAATGLWAVEMALVAGILTVVVTAWKPVMQHFSVGSKQGVAGAMLAVTNTASEFGYGSIIAALPGFLMLSDTLKHAIPNPLINEAVSVQMLAGIVGSATGGLSIALAAMSDIYIEAATAAGIPLEVMHRVAAMASGGMDSLPHNGAVITMLAVTGLTHRQAYAPIFACTIIKTITVFFVIAIYYLFGIV